MFSVSWDSAQGVFHRVGRWCSLCVGTLPGALVLVHSVACSGSWDISWGLDLWLLSRCLAGVVSCLSSDWLLICVVAVVFCSV